MTKAHAVERYHPLLVVLHWVLAVAIIGNLAAGGLILSEMPNDHPAKPGLLRLHMATGLTILALMLVRIVSRLVTKKPPVPHKPGPLKWLAVANHWAFYFVIFGMLATGLGMAALGNLFPLLRGANVPLPASFEQLPPHAGHVFWSSVLIGLIALHLAGVIYHYAVKKENLLSRMWFGPRERAEGAGPTHAPVPQ
jgi:cytochrome b561